MTTSVFLVRHGRTVLNAQDRLRGLADPPLDEVGVAQAEAVAAALDAQDVVAVHSSPLGRAVATAQVIAARFGINAMADPRFNDRDYGPWTGHERAAVIAQFGSVSAAPGVESTDSVLARVRPALDAVRRDGHAVVVVSHDAVISPLVHAIDPAIDAVIPTGSWSELRWQDGEWTVVSAGTVPERADDQPAHAE